MINEKQLVEVLKRQKHILTFEDSNPIDEGFNYGIDKAIQLVFVQPKVGVWIPVEERLPKEYKCYIDEETGYYSESDNVLCCCKNEYNEFEYWIDYTIDGEWQTHEYFDGEKFYWQQLPALPEPYKGETE
jgi:hypothetical protein